MDPLFAFAFLQSFVEILQEYFGTVSAATMKDNFDVVYQASSLQALVLLMAMTTKPCISQIHSSSKKPLIQAATH